MTLRAFCEFQFDHSICNVLQMSTKDKASLSKNGCNLLLIVAKLNLIQFDYVKTNGTLKQLMYNVIWSTQRKLLVIK